MATETIEAIYEQGGFRLITSVGLKLSEGQKVRLVVECMEDPDAILALAAEVYEGLTDLQINSMEEHIRRRDDFFNERTPEG